MTNELKDRISKIRSGEVPNGYKKTVCGIIPDEWNICKFKQKFTRLKSKNCEGNSNILTISAQYGLINQEEFFKKEVASDDKSNYYLLNKGDFAYNKSYSNGYPYGAIKPLTRYEKGIVSPLYICFSPADDSFCTDYYTHYFEFGLLNKEIHAIAQEGARNHGLLNVSVDDFFNTNILCPPLPEQQKIAEILSTQDKVIDLIQNQIEELKKLKKAYLQKMFPQKGSLFPEIRFKGFTNAWEQRELGATNTFFTDGNYGEAYPKSSDMTDSGSGIPFLTGGNLKDGKLSLDGASYITPEKHSKLTSGHLLEDDIVIAVRGSLGALGYVNTDNSGWNINSQLAILRTDKSELYGKFLIQYLLSWTGQNELLKRQTGSALKQLPIGAIKDVEVPITSIAEQGKIGEYFADLDNLITLHQRKLEQEQQKKKALMQLLLTGIVRVKI